MYRGVLWSHIKFYGSIRVAVKLNLRHLVIMNKNHLTVVCTTHGERKLISIRCQKECLESKLDGHTDVHSDYIAYCMYLLVVQNFDIT